MSYIESSLPNETITTRKFLRTNIQSFHRWYSYSSLSAKKIDKPTHTHVQFADDVILLENGFKENTTTRNMFTLPKGKNTGNLIHGIFEEITFTDETTFKPVIQHQLQKFGFDVVWLDCLLEMLKITIHHPLINDLKLSSIGNSDRLVEMNFNFPLKNLDIKELSKAVGSVSKNSRTNLTGIMNGFIDLIFRKNGEYYILDYKSNHLGDSFEFYSENALKDEMNNSNYMLQYYIYLVAFLRFMKSTYPDFKYEKNFGGIIYLFVRGIDAAVPSSGVYFAKPEFNIIKNIDRIMDGLKLDEC